MLESTQEWGRQNNAKINFLILGQSGAGKSTTLNRLLDGCSEKAVSSRPDSAAKKSVNKTPKIFNGYLYDRPCGIIDQAGFGDTDGMDDETIMGKALMYLVNRASSMNVDGFIIVQSAKADRTYIERNLLILKAVFGDAAPRRTIILVTKAEDVLDDSPMSKRKRALVITKMKEYARIASIYGAAKPIFWFNNFDERDEEKPYGYLYAEALMKQIGLEEKDIRFYLPY